MLLPAVAQSLVMFEQRMNGEVREKIPVSVGEDLEGLKQHSTTHNTTQHTTQHNTTHNTDGTFVCLSPAANQGDADARCSLGVCYANGKGVQQDKTEAVQRYRKAAEQGDADAQFNLAHTHTHTHKSV